MTVGMLPSKFPMDGKTVDGLFYGLQSLASGATDLAPAQFNKLYVQGKVIGENREYDEEITLYLLFCFRIFGCNLPGSAGQREPRRVSRFAGGGPQVVIGDKRRHNGFQRLRGARDA